MDTRYIAAASKRSFKVREYDECAGTAAERERVIFCRGESGKGGGSPGHPRIYVQPEWHDCANHFAVVQILS